MKTALTLLTMTTALALPSLAEARPVTFKINMANYGGRGAYLAIYLTDAQGHYKSTLWLAGGRARYFGHLSDWMAVTGGRPGDVTGHTGASIGSGQRSEIIIDVPDALIDAGYNLRVDLAAENMWPSASEIVEPFNTGNHDLQGRYYLSSFAFSM